MIALIHRFRRQWFWQRAIGLLSHSIDWALLFTEENNVAIVGTFASGEMRQGNRWTLAQIVLLLGAHHIGQMDTQLRARFNAKFLSPIAARDLIVV